MRVENFELKKTLAFDRKKYLDLKDAFLELRSEMKEKEREMYLQNPDLQAILLEKLTL